MSTAKDLKGAEYNPRFISDEKLEELRQSVAEYGDLSGITFNINTGNLVTGHQRTSLIPADAKVVKDAFSDPTGTVAIGFIVLPSGEKFRYREVDWDERKEKLANVQANRQFGEFDPVMLEELMRELKVDYSGYEQIDFTSMAEEMGIRDIRVEPVINDDLLNPVGSRAFRSKDMSNKIRFGVHEIIIEPEGFKMWLDAIKEEAEHVENHVLDLIKQKLGVTNECETTTA